MLRNVDRVRVGCISVNKKPSSNDFTVENTTIHPGYKYPKAYDDVAVIRLTKDITLSDKVRPICLDEDELATHESKIATVFGWGAEESGTGSEGAMSRRNNLIRNQ